MFTEIFLALILHTMSNVANSNPFLVVLFLVEFLHDVIIIIIQVFILRINECYWNTNINRVYHLSWVWVFLKYSKSNIFIDIERYLSRYKTNIACLSLYSLLMFFQFLYTFQFQ